MQNDTPWRQELPPVEGSNLNGNDDPRYSKQSQFLVKGEQARTPCTSQLGIPDHRHPVVRLAWLDIAT